MRYSPEHIAKAIHGELLGSNSQVINHVSVDSRSIQNSGSTVFFALKTDKRNGHDFIPELIEKGVQVFVVSQDVEIDDKNISIIKVSDTLEALQHFAQWHREQFSVPVIGITGSYGKTMVKEWLYQLLSSDYSICRNPKSYNSQLGVPLSVLKLNETHTLGIFEAGISRKGEMEKLEVIIKPSIGVLTKMGEAHQEGFESLEEKEEEKRKLFVSCEKVIELPIEKSGITVPFTDKASIENCEICIAVMLYLGYSKEDIQERINELTPLALRLEMKKGKQNSTVINDGYNISFSSLVLSLEYLKLQAKEFPRTLIISDIPETSFEDKELIELLNSQKLDKLLVVSNQKMEGIICKELHQFSSTAELVSKLDGLNLANHFILIKGSRKYKFERIAGALEEKNHRTVLEVNLTQLVDNLNVYKKKIKPTTKLMVMVKAFAYGTGTVEIPRLLEHEGIDYLGVAYTDEGIALREGGVLTPIIVMNPEPGTFAKLIENNLEPEIYSLDVLDEFIRTLILLEKKDYPIHLKLETGMNRLGFLPSEVPKLIQEIQSQPEVYIKTIFSHLSSADELEEKEFTMSQINLFETLSSQIMNAFSYSIDRHILNTAGIENYLDYQFDMVRLGIGLYGINVAKNSEIKPISSLKTVVIQLKNLQKGDSIGYGRKTIAEKAMTIGILPIGYSDGLRRSLGNGKYSFYVNGKQCFLAGNVCMDICMIDVTETSIKVGDEVEIFGEHNSIEQLATAMDTIPYEVLTSVSQRVKRVFYQE